MCQMKRPTLSAFHLFDGAFLKLFFMDRLSMDRSGYGDFFESNILGMFDIFI